MAAACPYIADRKRVDNGKRWRSDFHGGRRVAAAWVSIGRDRRRRGARGAGWGTQAGRAANRTRPRAPREGGR
ncbi:unnamed protein product [Leptosia nina]|uniref:Uncharacterized protein n=1 Tax=Leptosia nina TaxID=320188 RepID=A0AAV1IXC6_9NEOP